MRIAVNTRLLLPGKLEGIGWFTYETLKRITKDHPEHEFLFIFDRKWSKEFIFNSNVKPFKVGLPTRHPLLWYFWFERTIPKFLKKQKVDLFLSPDGYMATRSNVPTVPVMHDINFEHYPEDLPKYYRDFYQYFFPRYAYKAKRIATVSEYSKQDIAKTYNVSEDKIDVVYNGANELYRPLAASAIEETRKDYTQGAPYFLFIGALHPRKNIVNLLKAFDAFRASKDSDVKLLIVGEKKWWTEPMREAFEAMKFKEEVIFAGRLAPEKLRSVIGAALSMVYVSYFEGFGIPILEAMQCDVPVLTSNVTSMPEVAGEAAVLADPFSVDSIKDGMLQLAGDATLRQNLVEKGRIQREKFSWQKTADRLWACVEKASQGIS